MGKGFQNLYGTELGFGKQSILTVRMNTKGLRYAEDPAVHNLVTMTQQQIAALPGVRSVALEGPNIPTDDWAGSYFTQGERTKPEDAFLGVLHFVSPGYFQTLGVPIETGRDIEPTDVEQGLHVAVISESMAKQFWPDQSPLGKQVLLGKKTELNKNKWATVVGVVRDIRHDGLLRDDERPPYNVYFSLLQKVPRRPARLHPPARTEGAPDRRAPPYTFPSALLRRLPRRPARLNLLVRTEGAPGTLAPEVQARLRELAPDVPVYDVMTLEDRLSEQTASNRSFVLLMSLFAFFALPCPAARSG